jgi:hypothetical protein
MLSSLSSADHIIEILSQKDFDVSILNACLTHKDHALLNVVGREVLVTSSYSNWYNDILFLLLPKQT